MNLTASALYSGVVSSLLVMSTTLGSGLSLNVFQLPSEVETMFTCMGICEVANSAIFFPVRGPV